MFFWVNSAAYFLFSSNTVNNSIVSQNSFYIYYIKAIRNQLFKYKLIRTSNILVLQISVFFFQTSLSIGIFSQNSINVLSDSISKFEIINIVENNQFQMLGMSHFAESIFEIKRSLQLKVS